MNEKDRYAPCLICNKWIHTGERYVLIERKVEELGPDGIIEVHDSCVLAVLCASCGEKNPEGAIRLAFVG